jgi:hypothetical protein
VARREEQRSGGNCIKEVEVEGVGAGFSTLGTSGEEEQERDEEQSGNLWGRSHCGVVVEKGGARRSPPGSQWGGQSVARLSRGM